MFGFLFFLTFFSLQSSFALTKLLDNPYCSLSFRSDKNSALEESPQTVRFSPSLSLSSTDVCRSRCSVVLGKVGNPEPTVLLCI